MLSTAAGARAALPLDDLAVAQHPQGGNRLHAELLRRLGSGVGVDLDPRLLDAFIESGRVPQAPNAH